MNKLSNFIFNNNSTAWLWLAVRLYVGWEWLIAGWSKVQNPAWVGADAGGPVTGFLNGALAKTAGDHPDVSGWYAWLIENIALPNASAVSYLVAYGEVLVGAALILGIFVGWAALLGAFMNINYLWAGTVSSNPTLLLLGIFLILARRPASIYGLDRFISKFRHRRS